MSTDQISQAEQVLRAAGFVAADEESIELWAAADGEPELFDKLVARRLTGEPLAWITGVTSFCGLEIKVAPGVYVPRWQSEELARRAASRLPANGLAIDLCTGSGAIAAFLSHENPGATVLALDLSDDAVDCARSNGVAAFKGDLFGVVPKQYKGQFDVVVSVVPYVPTTELRLLPHDTLDFESMRSYDGGPDGTNLLRRVVSDATHFLTPAGALLLELGGEQADALVPLLETSGYQQVNILRDEDTDVRGIEAIWD